MHRYGQLDIVVAVRLLQDLRAFTAPGYAVVPPDLAVLLHAQRVVRGGACISDTGGSVATPNRLLESGKKTSHIYTFSRLGGGMSVDPQFLRNTSLQRAKSPFRAEGFGRVRRDLPDPELYQRAADLDQVMLVDFAARLRCQDMMRAAIGEEHLNRSVPADRLGKPLQAQHRALCDE